MSNRQEVLRKVEIIIPVYRGSIEYGLEMNNIDVTKENVQKAAKLMAKKIAAMKWYYEDEPLFGDDAAFCIVENNINKF